MTMVLAHELGHALRLKDTRGTACNNHIMATDFETLSVRTVQPDECDAADGQWETDNEPDTDLPDPSDNVPFDLCFFDPDGFLCTGSGNPPGSGGPYCRFNCTCVSVNGSFPDPDGGGGGFPPGGGTGGPTLCVDDPHSPLRCNWFPALLIDPESRVAAEQRSTSARDDCDHRWSCHWDCYNSPPPGGNQGGPTSRDLPVIVGDGPGLLMVRPRPGWVVSGTIPVALTVDHYIDTTELLGVVVDGAPVTLSETYSHAEAVGICEQDAVEDPDCPFIGFGGMLDTRQLSDGVHQLVAIARRNGPDEGFLTWVETMIEVRNQTSPAMPQVHIAESWGGHTHVPIGGHFSFGQRDLDDLPLVATYFVCNLGNERLTLLNHGTMVTGNGFGRNPNGPAGRIAPFRCSQLGVRFQATEPGFYSGAVDVRSDDPDQPSYSFSVSGEAVTTATEPPRIGIGLPQENAILANAVLLKGWAIDDDYLEPESIALAIDGAPASITTPSFGEPWHDACVAHPDLGSPDCPNVGWSAWLNSTGLTDGPHRLDVTVTDSAGQVTTQSRWFLTEHSPNGEPARVRIAAPAHGETISGAFLLRGWALATSNLETVDLRFYLDGNPILPGNPFYGTYRPDVCAAHPDLGSPDCPNVGWEAIGNSTLIDNGPHTLQLFVTDGGGNLTVFTRHFSVAN